jgi:predicted enzyme related to lactoylglutathione lyase
VRIEVAIDINDPDLMIPFYESLLGYVSNSLDNERYGTDQIYYSSNDPAGKGPKIIFQVVPEFASAKNRLHLDLHVADIEQITQRAVELGATRLDVQPIAEAGTRWIRLADPEGNIFCVVESM